MDNNVEWYLKKRVDRTLESLKNNNMKGYYIEKREQLFEILKNLIIEKSIIGIGDSITLSETGVIDFLREGNYEFLDKYRDGITSEEKKQIYIQNFSADTFICSTNALTENGELYNIDGNGSRVAPMIYGPK
ncbi:lactate utilization protein, partial [Clostridium beijerinckii]